MRVLPAEAERFLEGLRGALAALPAAERDDIVAEIRSHLEERAERGEPDLVGAFGPAEAYAATFLQERNLSGALARGSSWAMGRALLSGARKAGWWYLVVVLAILHLYGLSLIALAALKPLFPDNVGLFAGGGTLALGAAPVQPGAREFLGWWAIPAFLGAGIFILWSANWTLCNLARRRLAQLRAGLWA